jgi:hypothetical protein
VATMVLVGYMAAPSVSCAESIGVVCCTRLAFVQHRALSHRVWLG